ncbi:MAG TPA: hypothetical protein DEO38_03075 [Bacteroidales bacterium]|nr:hypothetical protein [Bacteroidales bacterium]
MILNYIWIGFIIVALIMALVQLAFFGDVNVFNEMVNALFSNAKTGFEISLGLTGVLSLWMGILKIGEKSGLIERMSKMVAPVLSRLFPEIPAGHPAMGSIFMNVAANMLGLDNAATPLGLKAMNQLQELNPAKDKASNSMIMFLVLNTTGLTLIPVSVMVYRAQMGAVNPSDVFIPILMATFCSTLFGLLIVCIKQGIRLWDKVLLGFIGTMVLFIAALAALCSHVSQEQLQTYSTLVANMLLIGIIVFFVVYAAVKRVNAYDAFIEGAKDGFSTAVGIIPYLIAILIAVGIFRASGAMDLMIDGIRHLVAMTGLNTDFVEALPTAMMKPLSGSGARGLMVDAMQQYGADSFVGRLVCTIQGSTDTTLYILAVYFGAVKIRDSRYALPYGLMADLVGIIAAILITYAFFG